MGLTIHYQGCISDKHLLPELIEELEEISKVHGWNFRIFEREFPEDRENLQLEGFPLNEALTKYSNDGLLYGIWFIPPKCDPVSVTFLKNGRLCSPSQLQNWGESTDETERKYLYMNFSKTQYAGAEIHKMVIGIFRYIAKRYLTDFEMSDEGEYWETNDEELLEENFKRNTTLIDGFKMALENNQRKESEDTEAYIIRILEEFHQKQKPGN